MAWRDEYSCGNELIDQQHKRLVDLINRLHADYHLGRSNDMLYAHFISLFQYVSEHFLHEENLMTVYRLPLADQHRAEHAKFRKQVEELFEEYGQGRCEIITLLELLQGWFIDHVTDTDKLTFARLTEDGS